MNSKPTSSRRHFLKTTGLTLALPALESFRAGGAAKTKAQRLVCIGTYLGFHQPAFFPKQSGKDYELSTLLKPIGKHREDLTVFSGLDHRAAHGHPNWNNYPNSYSLDQMVADRIGRDSRFASLHRSRYNFFEVNG